MTQYNLSVILDIPCSRPPVCGCADRDDSGSGQAVSVELTHPDLSFDLTGQVNFPTVISGLQLPTIGTVWENRKKCRCFISQVTKMWLFLILGDFVFLSSKGPMRIIQFKPTYFFHITSDQNVVIFDSSG